MAKKHTIANTPLDPTVAKTEITLNGKKFYLAYDFNALAVSESLTGLNMLSAIDMRNLDAQKLRALLYAALLKFQPEMTLEMAGCLMPPVTGFSALAKALAETYYGANAVEDIVENPPLPETGNSQN